MSFTQPARVPDDAHVSDEDYDRFYRPRRKRSEVTDPRDPAYDDRHREEHPVTRVVRCVDCEAIGEREVFEGEAAEPCGFCGSRDVEAA